ncbi:MAG: hypothetical protein R3B47_14455 [Bacteroidia bacterium]
MEDKRDLLGSYLGCLHEGEAPQVARWLAMYYRGRRTHATILFELWWKKPATFRQPEKAWELLFEKRPFNNRLWHQIRHRLAEAIKGWLAWRYLEKQSWDVNFMAGMELVENRHHTEILWHYQSQLRTSEQVGSEQRYKMEALFQLAYNASQKLRPQPEAHLSAFEEFVIEEKLLHLFAGRRDPQLQDRSPSPMDKLAVELGKTSSAPQIILMSQLFELAPSEPQKGPSVPKLHAMHLDAWRLLNPDRNATILKVILQRAYRAYEATRDKRHLEDYHKVLDWGIERRMFPAYQAMDINTLLRIVQQSLVLDRPDKAKAYLKKLGPMVFEEARKEHLPVLEAFILLNEGAWESALAIAEDHKTRYGFWRTGLNMLLVELACRFELGEDDPEDLVNILENRIRTLHNYRSNEQHPWLVELYMRLARELARLFMKKAVRDTELLQDASQNAILQYLRKKRLNE